MNELGINKMQKALRIAGFLVISLILRWPIWIILAALRPFKLFDYLFLVYPGTDKDLDGYCPRWLAKSWLFSGKPTLGATISKGSAGRGLVLVVPNTAQELMLKKKTCEHIVRRLETLGKRVGVKSIAIAGQGPAMIERHGIKLEQPFVKGNKGTVFCVMEAVAEAMRKHRLEKGKFKIALVGVGYVGGILLDALKEEGHDIVGIDIMIRRHGILLPKESYPALNNSDMVIVLTPRGSDFVPYIAHLKNGGIVIDDTHPRIEQQPEGVHFYKVAVGMPDVEFTPRLPGYETDWIPGCAVEAMYSAATADFNGTCQQDFNKTSKKLGFYAHMTTGVTAM